MFQIRIDWLNGRFNLYCDFPSYRRIGKDFDLCNALGEMCKEGSLAYQAYHDMASFKEEVLYRLN